MKLLSKQKIFGISLLLLLTSLACNLPYGIGYRASTKDEGREAVAQVATPLPTPTPTATYLPTYTPTTTPEPTATATLVVPLTATPTPMPVSQQPVPVEGTVLFVNVEGTVVLATAPPPPPPSLPVASSANVIVNGSFDDPWPDDLSLAPGWTPFDSGQAHFGWYKETWGKVVYEGAQAQMIEIINDQGVGDRFAGIYQTVNVVPGAEYELVIHGLVRTDEGSEGLSGSGYEFQYGIDHHGGSDWQAVTEWISLPFPEHPREDPAAKNVYTYGTHTVRFRPSRAKLTLFIRGWKRWPDLNEVNFDVDALSLHGTGGGCACTPTPTLVAFTPAAPTILPPTQPPPSTATATPTLMPGVTPTPGPTATATLVVASPTATFTPALPIPVSGGEVQPEATSTGVNAFSALSVIILIAGAVWGLTRRRA